MITSPARCHETTKQRTEDFISSMNSECSLCEFKHGCKKKNDEHREGIIMGESSVSVCLARLKNKMLQSDDCLEHHQRLIARTGIVEYQQCLIVSDTYDKTVK